MNGLKIMITEEGADVFAPYNQDFVKAIKKIGESRWNPRSKCWSVPVDALPAVRNIMLDIYGCDDQETPETVKLKIKIINELCYGGGDVMFCGKVLCHAGGRDSGGRAGQDVFYMNGEPLSGGSAKYWASVVPEGAVIDVSNVSKIMYEKFLENNNGDIEILSVSSKEINKGDLLDEKEKLLKRISEIDKLLGN